MEAVLEKDVAYQIVDSMPQTFTWDDLLRVIYVRKEIAKGLADVKAGRVKPLAEVFAKYGVEE